jgi:hypothetical protein
MRLCTRSPIPNVLLCKEYFLNFFISVGAMDNMNDIRPSEDRGLCPSSKKNLALYNEGTDGGSAVLEYQPVYSEQVSSASRYAN